MITNAELAQALHQAFAKSAGEDQGWSELEPQHRHHWFAVAEAAWELIESENTIWAAESNRRAEDLAGLLVEFVNRAEDILA
jgi:hypothetical protein